MSSAAESPTQRGAVTVLTLSTVGFTLMFAVWLMFGILGVPIRDELKLTDVQLSWLTAVAVLNGSIWRLPAGIVTDRFGGRRVFTVILLLTAVPTFLVSFADNYGALLLLAFFVGVAGNSFSSGIAWNSAWWPASRQGFALGVFGAGNVGASVTKIIGPVLITATVGVTYAGWLVGGWRLIPVLYAVLLVVMAAVVWFVAPTPDLFRGRGRSLRSQLEPLKSMRVWRFGLYYVAVFGAYVALAAWLPLYYVDNYDLELAIAALLTASFIFPASLLRPLGGWFSDRFGARRVMYGTFTVMIAALFFLSLPAGHLIVETTNGAVEALPFALPLWVFATLVFILGCAMGIGKAAVFKHIPDYFPTDVGAVGGLVGTLGGLGGFALPPLFAYTLVATSLPTSTFAILLLLTIACAVWMHFTVWGMLHTNAPQLAGQFEAMAPGHSVPTP